MVILQSHIYFFMNLPTFVFGIGILSHIFFGHIRPLYVALWSITGSTLSLALSTYGEIGFFLMYAWYMSRTNASSDKFWIFIFMEVNLIIITIQACVIKAFAAAGSKHLASISVCTAFLLTSTFAAIVIWLITKKKKQLDQFRTLIREQNHLQKSIILYTGATCVSLYCFEAISNLVNIDVMLDLLLLGIYTLSVIINLYSLFLILKSFSYYVELTWIKRAEASQRAYYTTLSQQQKNTNKLLHDYKNLLASLQLSLQQSSAAISPDTQAILSRAQASLNQAELGKSSFTSIKSDPLKSLLYLKWAESMNHNVIMNVQTEGVIHPLESALGFAIIRALGILIDNALEETVRIKHHRFDVTLIALKQGLEVSVMNDVGSDFNPTDLEKKDFTTKGDGHGNGLSIINELMQQNKNILIRKSVINQQLKITLFIGDS
ncbi:GHKL domain-containing protein [Lacticaseibacillus chiayiensis]|uniref:ATP-binding protein n=3 Tax=Lacticaseibacillus chiayiensis TaxID=2100821 RepID=A0ABY6H3S6_9LACO|nr:GHKL domain-containing protein [Lacticaseibacillus chiayiensis]QVI34210.1 GHKL domain-containing protein [Lacticaseibacillus chiayiensis]UYN55990.1 ATP-binding protein [Lacticaseibacillus chiayiensis]